MCPPLLGKPKAPKPVAPPPTRDDEAAGAAALQERLKRAKAGGASSTILTSPLGTSAPAPVTRNTLGG